MFRKRVQLGLIHMAVAITLVPINSTLNRIMIKELAISATLVALLVSLPYVISPIQVAIGSYADNHPIAGRRRTPYILLGLWMCVAGALLAPYAAFQLADPSAGGILLAILAFGLWGMGYNFSAVSYLSLASEIDEKRSRTIAIMFLLMTLGIIFTAYFVGRIVDPYSPQALYKAFWVAGGAALVFGMVGLIKLEPRFDVESSRTDEHHSWGEMLGAVLSNPQARIFFWYLLLLLAALLGQDVLLEPFAGEAFGMSPAVTTRITSIWGTATLVTLLLANWLQRRSSKRTVAVVGNWGALIAFALIGVSGLMHSTSAFYSGVVLLGLGTGLSTVSNLSLMLDMTTPQNVGLFIGAWGVANALSRLTGQVIGGAVRDMITLVADSALLGYVVVFFLEAAFLGAALALLGVIDVAAFRRQAGVDEPGPASMVDAAALLGEAQGG